MTWPLLQYCKTILCLLSLIFHELGLGNKGNWEWTKIKSKLTWNQLWPVTYYNQRYIVTTFFRSPSSISNVGQSFILSHTGRYNSNSDLFVLPNSLTINVHPKLKTSEAGPEGYFPSYRAGSIIMLMTWFESTCTSFACRNLDSQWFYFECFIKDYYFRLPITQVTPLEIKTLSPLMSYVKSHSNNDNKIPHNKALKCVAMMFQWHI